VQNWRDFWRMFAEDFTNNMVSVGCFDAHHGEKLVEISVAKDLHYAPEGFEEKYLTELNFMSSIIKLE
jgi:hypothetical protein